MLNQVAHALKLAGFRLFRVSVDDKYVTVTLANPSNTDLRNAKTIVGAVVGRGVTVTIR